MKTVHDVFEAAMGLMDELDGEGNAENRDTAEFGLRTPGIVNSLISEFLILSGNRGGFVPTEGMEDYLLKIPDVYALGVMHYGLAANLLVDEDPSAASFYEQRYEELRNLYFARCGGENGEVLDLYGGIEFGKFGRW